jgi:hypothetical protein
MGVRGSGLKSKGVTPRTGASAGPRVLLVGKEGEC